MENLLLHTCCAPCSASAIKLLSKDYKITSFWFNPNIYPQKEYSLRKDAWQDYCKSINIDTEEVTADWLSDEKSYDDLWLEKALKCENGRCYYCYKTRLEQTVKTAKKLSIKNFSTTLLSSPYQKHEIIKEIAVRLAVENNLNFVYVDPRSFFYEGVNSVRKSGFYSQKYCGCKLSVR